ncbi:MAG: class I adenylate-forming enzyme family protein [Acidimicrobiales bacterium]
MNVAMLLDLPSMICFEQTAVIAPDGTEVSYGELRANVSAAAGLLSSLGVGVGDRVGILSTNRVGFLEVLFGAACLGATVVPMNYRAGKDEAAHLLVDSGTKVLVMEARYQPLVDSVRPASLSHVLTFDGDYETRRDAAEPNELVEDVEDDALATLLYTSGTTSMPKGVMLKHGAITGYVMGTNECADGEDHGRTLLAAPLYHVAGLTSTMIALYSGRVVVMLDQFETASWLAAVNAHQVTHAFLVPTMLARLLDDDAFGGTDLSSLVGITYGAAPMPPSVIRRAIDTFPRSVAFSQAYGQTETTATVSVLDPDDHRIWEGSAEDQERKLRRLKSVGKVLDDVEVQICDPEGVILGPNTPGEVWLRTFRAMDGYWGNPEKTRVTVDTTGWVHTGDLGFLDDDGYLFLSGRSGDMIIRGGENIAPEEVESVLYEHPDVIEAAVIGVPDDTWGERVVAAVVLRSGGKPEAIATHAREHLASFKRPEEILVFDELPRTSTGKLVRRNLLPLVEERLA